MSSIPDFIKEETRKRCHIFQVDAATTQKFTRINTELFHFLYNASSIRFTIYFRIDDTMIEFMKPTEFSKELLDQVWAAVENSARRISICVLKAELSLFEQAIAEVRAAKIAILLEKDPHLDRKTLDIFSNLSSASQLVVKGGITNNVVSQIESSAAYMVNNLMDSDGAISTLSRMVIHDPTLYDHSASVAMISGVIAKSCLKESLNRKGLEVIAQCGLYHDVGKTCVPSKILNKPGKFSDEEFEVMKKHTEWGEEELGQVIKKGAPIDDLAMRVAGEHHERFHGKGYPKGKCGRYEDDPVNGIHIYSRIVTIADVYSALLMKRVYKPAYEAQDAIKLMASFAENEYDPDIFNPFLKSVVKSLNSYQVKLKNEGKGRILQIGDDGKLIEIKKAVAS